MQQKEQLSPILPAINFKTAFEELCNKHELLASILVDAGNSTDFYQYVNSARQYYRRDVIRRVLNNTIVTRPFTVYQLADIIVDQVPKVIEQYDAKMVVVSDLLDMFVRDPQIGSNEATYLTNEIVNSITKSRVLEDVLVVVSYSYAHDLFHQNNKEQKQQRM